MPVQLSETWWDTFFSGMMNECWRMLRTERHTVPEADFIQKVLQRDHARILDVPCGAGRLAVELAMRGHEVAGVDLCEEFLAEARAASAEKALEIDWRYGDMRELPWRDHFDAAICFGTSFAFFDEPGNLESCATVCRALKPGGVFIVDTTKLLEIILPVPKLRGWARLRDIMLTYENHYDFESGFERTDYELYRDGQIERKSARQRIYTYHEMCGLMKRAGFQKCRGYSSLDMKPLRTGLDRLLLVATK